MHGLMNCNCTSGWGGYAALVLRVATGAIFAVHGYQKLTMMGVDGTAAFLDTLGFPIASVFAVVLIAVELLGGLALVAGAFVHWVSKLLAVVAVVALFLVHIGNGFYIQNGGYEFMLLILAATVSLMITGAGRFSVDEMLGKSRE